VLYHGGDRSVEVDREHERYRQGHAERRDPLLSRVSATRNQFLESGAVFYGVLVLLDHNHAGVLCHGGKPLARGALKAVPGVRAQ
jgi:hypothetical protein